MLPEALHHCQPTCRALGIIRLNQHQPVLSHPASVDFIPSSVGREDRVSMGMTYALKARQVMEFTRTCLAIEMLVASPALDFRAPARARRTR